MLQYHTVSLRYHAARSTQCFCVKNYDTKLANKKWDFSSLWKLLWALLWVPGAGYRYSHVARFSSTTVHFFFSRVVGDGISALLPFLLAPRRGFFWTRLNPSTGSSQIKFFRRRCWLYRRSPPRLTPPKYLFHCATIVPHWEHPERKQGGPPLEWIEKWRCIINVCSHMKDTWRKDRQPKLGNTYELPCARGQYMLYSFPWPPHMADMIFKTAQYARALEFEHTQ